MLLADFLGDCGKKDVDTPNVAANCHTEVHSVVTKYPAIMGWQI